MGGLRTTNIPQYIEIIQHYVFLGIFKCSIYVENKLSYKKNKYRLKELNIDRSVFNGLLPNLRVHMLKISFPIKKEKSNDDETHKN